MAPNVWTQEQIPDLQGKVVIVTGGTAGLGLASARELAAKHAHVIIAARSSKKTQQAVADVTASSPGAKVEGMELDLSDFRSIEAFARAFKAKGLPLHVLLNNAGVFLTPYAKTPQGFEMTLGVNHYGTWYLTQLLLDVLKASAPARIVMVNSGAAELIKGVDWEDLWGEKAKKSDMQQYNLSKAYNLMASFELGQRLQASKVDMFVISPGFVATDIQTKTDKRANFMARVTAILSKFLAQPLDVGVRSQLYAATAPAIAGTGPAAFQPKKGFSGPVTPWQPKVKPFQDAAQTTRMLQETERIIASLAH